MKYILTFLAFLFCGAAQAQDALVVATCGTLPLAYAPGATRLLTVDTTGKMCSTGGGGAGNPGGSNTQLQYNNAGSFGGITGATSNGTAVTLTSPIVNTTMTLGFLTGSTQCVQVNSSGVVSGTVCGGTSTAIPSDQTGANYAFQGTDLTKIIYLSNAAPQIPTIAQAGTGSFTNGWYTTACNIGAGTQTITPATSTIGGAATYVLPAGSAAAPNCIGLASDGTNYRVVPDFFRFGANVATAAGLALSAAGGLTTTVANGTSALGTGAVSSATCATAITTAATNTATTDVVLWGFNGDPTAVTGYVPLVAGMLTIIAYPSANNVNFKVCNNTSSSITPGAITLNWRVAR